MNTSSLKLTDSLHKLYKRPSKTAENLIDAGIESIEDLIWVIPKKILKLPPLDKFSTAKISQYFRGVGEVISVRSKPNFRSRGKGRALLFNISVTVKDLNSDSFITLQWFNCYSSIEKKIKDIKEIEFLGVVSEYNGVLQITNPEFSELGSMDTNSGLKIQYPTISSISSPNIKKIVDKIPSQLWDEIDEVLVVPGDVAQAQELAQCLQEN